MESSVDSIAETELEHALSYTDLSLCGWALPDTTLAGPLVPIRYKW